jgi:hypothetical protein
MLRRTGRDEEMGEGNATDQELTDLVGRTAEAASALIRGDIRRYLTLIRHADDYTLMAPSGWQLVHRHADPLAHEITMEQFASIARG